LISLELKVSALGIWTNPVPRLSYLVVVADHRLLVASTSLVASASRFGSSTLSAARVAAELMITALRTRPITILEISHFLRRFILKSPAHPGSTGSQCFSVFSLGSSTLPAAGISSKLMISTSITDPITFLEASIL